MVRWLILILFLWSFPMQLPQAVSPERLAGHSQETDPIHAAWSILLNKYVDAHGQVDYKGFMADSTALNAYLNTLLRNVPGPAAPKEEQLAFYINLYNAATVKLILNNYPLKSIKDIKNPWERDWIPLAGKLISLGYLEHQILRKMGEPRIHFAINCASNSCPKLANIAYSPVLLESQLEEATRGFIRDSTRNQLGSEHLELSQIFNWYKKDFTKDGSLSEYIAPYARASIRPSAKITYLKYDWNLNETQ